MPSLFFAGTITSAAIGYVSVPLAYAVLIRYAPHATAIDAAARLIDAAAILTLPRFDADAAR